MAEDDTLQEPVKKTSARTSKPKAEVSKMIRVYNPQRYFYRQPETGIRIGSKEITEIRDDSWAELQIKAGILEKAK